MWKAGDTLHVYELLAPIPGTAEKLWRARHTLNQSAVIVKRLDADDRERGALERLFARKLASPRLIAFLDLGADYAVMEDGGATLADWLQRDYDPTAAEPLVRELFAALADLHAAGLVHGDLKPLNVLVAENAGAHRHEAIAGPWRVRLIDFGLTLDVPADDFAHTLALTREQLGGTPLYLDPAVAKAPPEDLDARRRDPRADLYAAGIVAHEILFGAPPSYGESLPDWLRRCLGAWDDRFQDATAVLAALPGELAGDEGEHAEDEEWEEEDAEEEEDEDDGEDEEEDDGEDENEDDGEDDAEDEPLLRAVRDRVEHAIRDAEGQGTLNLNWLERLDADTARALAGWGRGESDDRTLHVNGVTVLDADTARALSAWGHGDSGDRELNLNGVTALDADAARALAGWGRGDSGDRWLSLGGVTALDADTARALSAWGHGDSGLRGLCLDGVTALDADTARALSGWGRGESGVRALSLAGLTALDTDTARALAAWGGGDSGVRALYLRGLTALDDAAKLALLEFKARDNCILNCPALDR